MKLEYMSHEENAFQNECYVEDVNKWTVSVLIVLISRIVEKLFRRSTDVTQLMILRP